MQLRSKEFTLATLETLDYLVPMVALVALETLDYLVPMVALVALVALVAVVAFEFYSIGLDMVFALGCTLILSVIKSKFLSIRMLLL